MNEIYSTTKLYNLIDEEKKLKDFYWIKKLDGVINKIIELEKDDEIKLKLKFTNAEYQLGRYYTYLEIFRDLYGLNKFFEIMNYRRQELDEAIEYFDRIYGKL